MVKKQITPTERIFVKISLLQCTCRSDCKLQALELSDENGGQRITPFKHSGSWRTIRTWECSFEPEELSLYAYRAGTR